MSKRDAGKPPIQLIDPDFIFALSEVLGFGADKYGPNDWKKIIPENIDDRTFGSIQRHLWAWKRGEKFDKESGFNHLLHAACQTMMLFWYTGSDKGGNNELRSKGLASTLQKAGHIKKTKKRD